MNGAFSVLGAKPKNLTADYTVRTDHTDRHVSFRGAESLISAPNLKERSAEESAPLLPGVSPKSIN